VRIDLSVFGYTEVDFQIGELGKINRV